MIKKVWKILLLLIFALFIYGCSTMINLTKSDKNYVTTYFNDNITINISNKVKDKEKVYSTILKDLQRINDFSPINRVEIDVDEKNVVPKVEGIIKCNSRFVNTEECIKELIKNSYEIYDNWISEGIYAKVFERDTKKRDFSKYYETHEFSLFGARFFEPFSSKEEIENVKSASVDLIEYLIKNNKKAELLKNQVKISDLEAWAKNKNINLSYQKEIESLMNRMEVKKLSPNTYLTLNTKEEINGFTIDIQTMDEQYDTAKKIEEFILIMDKNERKIKEGIKRDTPNFYKDNSIAIENVPKIHYCFDINGKINSAELEEDNIYLRSLLAQAHEYSHILIASSFTRNGIKNNKPRWLDEGMAEYLDMAYSATFKDFIQSFLYEMPKSKEDKDKLNKEEKNFYDNLSKILISNNIETDKLKEIESANGEGVTFCTILGAAGIKFSRTITPMHLATGSVFLDGGEVLKQKEWPMGKGNYINYYANQSFTNYLIHEYGLEKLLYLMVEDFNTLTYEEYFGKSYEDLKVDWVKYLKKNIKDIELIL